MKTLIGFLLKVIRIAIILLPPSEWTVNTVFSIHRKSVASCGGLLLLMPYNVLVCSVLKEVRLGAKPQVTHSTGDYI